MRLVFSGAAHEVTGSCHYLEVGDTRLFCRLRHGAGENIYENIEPRLLFGDVDYVL